MKKISTKREDVSKRIATAKAWRAELAALHELLVEAGLSEELKWGKPTFTYNGTNVAIIAGMKETCALAFFKGVLLKDTARILEPPGKNSRSTRWAKFRSMAEIEKHAGAIKDYAREAMDLERAGARVDMKAYDTLKAPPELKKKLASDTKFKKAFQSLTPGRQRAYTLHFADAKQAATRDGRIAKHEKRILAGKGMMDK